ncbi:DUF1450 domain-containing protein [Bacillus sp. V3B]|uniref:DUF1450 domain-containing protein n=1 Tax=Bacillus sp. V3B TaxID=2804915 RepID=UPI00210C167A|nr:DUF1450 domain-containing protein [Bacillus sp. V3B]MCQ6275245.1 DUF1450 domain-containing protein [Bacillus sp. V3B]
MIKPTVGFCVINLENGAREAREILEKDPNLNVVGYGCIRYCGTCDRSPYALVDGKVVTGKTPEQLVENIYRFLEKQLIS